MRSQIGKALGLTLLASSLGVVLWGSGPRAGAEDRTVRSGIGKSGFDEKARPQDDLFRHVNGGWIAEAKIPAEYGYFGTFMELRDKALADLRAIIEEAARQEGASSDSEARKIGDLYTGFMDEKKVEEQGLKPIHDELARIDAIKDKAGFLRIVAELQRQGVGGMFRLFVAPDAKRSDREIVYLSQGGLSLPDESYYRDPKFKLIRDAFVEHVERTFALAGRPEPAKAAAQVMELETRLAKHHWDRVKSRDQTLSYNKKDRADLGTLTPGFDWSSYFDGTGAKGISELIVRQPDYLGAMAKAYHEVPLDQWKTWLAWHVIDSAAPYLNKAMVDENFAFARKLTGATELPPRWKRGVTLVEGALGEAAGKLYVARHFPPEAKARMQVLVKNLIEAYREDIQGLAWMSPETKKKALEKLAKFTPKIGYPDKWRDYTKLEVRRDDLLGNVRRADAFEHDRNLAKLGKPVDRSEWGMTPQTINAYYNPMFNEIVFPAAILQPPFFDRNADDAVNYGAIGAVIGHEIGHGFDDQGSKFDGDGNMKNWWTEADRMEFDKRAGMLIEQYNGFSPAQLPGQHVNGALTIGENIGDLGGLTIAFKAYKISLKGADAPVIDSWTGDQRFFIGWAQAWRSKYRDAELARRLATDPHSPTEFRCNGVVRNLSEFYAAFGVKEGDKLWLPPDRRVRIW
ncbi:MAG: M13 family metallopeptidase [Isosphaeraceae bacterium]